MRYFVISLSGHQIRTSSRLFLSCCLLTLAGCINARNHIQDLHPQADQEFTVGVVQREIRTGMSQGDVATALGSPNIVDKDSEGYETWIYDKIATMASYSRSSGGYVGAGGVSGTPGSALLLGLGGGAYSQDAGANATTQKTLTVVIKFGKDRKVRDFSYHSSKF